MSYIDELFKSGVWGTKEPTEPEWVKWIHRNLSENHCPECLKLDGCYFLKEKAPKHPHHPYCHCLLNSISYNTVLKNAKAVSDYSKYDPYLFNPEYAKKHGKDTGETVSYITGWMVYPNGEIQLTTPYGGK